MSRWARVRLAATGYRTCSPHSYYCYDDYDFYYYDYCYYCYYCY